MTIQMTLMYVNSLVLCDVMHIHIHGSAVCKTAVCLGTSCVECNESFAASGTVCVTFLCVVIFSSKEKSSG